MNVLYVEPRDNQHYWWLAQYLAEMIKAGQTVEREGHWSLRFCSSDDPVGRVGVFIGPIAVPLDLPHEYKPDAKQ